jgi:hypothetical protein
MSIPPDVEAGRLAFAQTSYRSRISETGYAPVHYYSTCLFGPDRRVSVLQNLAAMVQRIDYPVEYSMTRSVSSVEPTRMIPTYHF